MTRLLLILLFQIALSGLLYSQSFSVDDLVSLSVTPIKNQDNFLKKKNFETGFGSSQYIGRGISFFEKKKKKSEDSTFRKVDIYKDGDIFSYAYTTSSKKEYEEGWQQLAKDGFIEKILKDGSLPDYKYFQKKNFTVDCVPQVSGEEALYTITLRRKELPDMSEIQYAEDLLKFTSHEYLVSFFGWEKVKKDLYYFSEKELKKCSVLFPNSSKQALFIWGDEENYDSVSYVLISGILPTVNAVQFSNYLGHNKWLSKKGLYAGMTLQELIEANEADFDFYGQNTELSFMAVPQNSGVINFEKTGIMLGCVNCNGADILNKPKVSAYDALKKGLPLYLFYIMVSP